MTSYKLGRYFFRNQWRFCSLQSQLFQARLALTRDLNFNQLFDFCMSVQLFLNFKSKIIIDPDKIRTKIKSKPTNK